jgi:pepF/M3 family oligoendopeptidase
MDSRSIQETGTKNAGLRWDLESIFPGESKSKEYAEFRAKLKKDLTAVRKAIAKLPPRLNNKNVPDWIKNILKVEDIQNRLQHAFSYAQCLISQDVNDEAAIAIYGEMDVIHSDYKALMVALEAFAMNQSDDWWKKLVNNPALDKRAFGLTEMRQIARMKMKPEFEELTAELAVNGYHAWNRLYDKIYGDLRVKFTEEDGRVSELSLGQLSKKMSSSNRAVRRQAHEKLEGAWETVANQSALALNYQAGFRLSVYKRRGWKSPLIEPLQQARLSEKTLMAMWSAVEKAIPRLKKYINAKKKLLAIDQFKWYDQFAPTGTLDKKITFAEAGDFIYDLISGFSKPQADFSRMALENRWVEAEDRPGKGGGGYCTTLSVAKQSRIFMTYSDTFNDMATLAHELGHAYHHHVLRDIPPFGREYPLTLAECASTFNELLVFDGAVGRTQNSEEKLLLLDQGLQRTFALFPNIYARFIFDSEFYKERAEGLVSRSRLDEIMLNAQKKAYGDILEGDDAWHPLFWASKLHFFLTNQPFYNFPYTFGFLFACGVYSRAKAEGAKFSPKYIALLADSGQMNCEKLARKHLGVDLTKEDFWKESVNMALADVDEFVKLVG